MIWISLKTLKTYSINTIKVTSLDEIDYPTTLIEL